MVSFQSLSEASSRPTFPWLSHPSYGQLREMWTHDRSLSEFTLKPFVLSPGTPQCPDVDYLVELISEAQRDPSEFGAWVFEQSARILMTREPTPSYVDNNEFTHAVKYLFLGACFKPCLRTLLDRPDTVPLATSLVNLTAGFCEVSSSLGTTPLIIRSIMVANMRDWVAHRDLSEFSFKPDVLTSPRFLELIREHTAREERDQPPGELTRVSAPFLLNQKFCEATSPSEFLLWVFENNIVVPRNEVIPVLRRLLVEHLGPKASLYPFLSRLETLPDQGTSQPLRRQFSPGYYFDVFGTLINHDGTPNVRLIQRMIDLWKCNPSCPVYLVSDSQTHEVKRALEFLPEMPPLLAKEALDGMELECLIDNCGPKGQGLHAQRHLLPDAFVGSDLVSE